MGKKIDSTKVAEVDEKTKAILLQKGYRLETAIGKGSYGEVYKAVKLKTSKICAVKVMSLDLMNERFRKKFLPRELATMMETKHENIVRVYDIFKSNRKIYVFMEFAEHGELGDFIKKYGSLSEDRAHRWFTQTTRAILYLHEELFTAHRDIKIDNILLADRWVAKVTDFGFAKQAIDEEGNVKLSETYCGTRPYYPPQILMRRPYDPFKSDVWALGIVLYSMLHNRYPFHFKDIQQMIEEQTDLEYRVAQLNRNLSKECKTLLLSMLEPNEEKRLSCSEVLDHNWIKLRLKNLDNSKSSK